MFFLEVVIEPVNDDVIEVITAESCITGCGENFEGTVCDIENGDIECSAAEVIYENLLFLGVVLVHAECECGCGRLVDDTYNIEACDPSCVLGCLTLCVIEVCRYRDNCLFNLLTKICFRIALDVGQDHRRYFLRCVFLAFQGNLFIGAHLTLDGINRVLVGDHLTLCGITDDTVAVLECDDGRSCTVSFRVCNNFGFLAFHNCCAAICCT